jgi:hypothetical protein
MYDSMTNPMDSGHDLFGGALMGLATPLRKLVYHDEDRQGEREKIGWA